MKQALSPRLVPLLLGIGLFFVYVSTLAPGLSWANGGSDGGDLVTAVATNGIPHPTGYPTYLLLAEFFEVLPFSTLAYRLNLLSAMATTAAALCIFWTVAAVAGAQNHKRSSCLAGLIAGLSYGLAPMVWGQATITEVYALQGFLTALILFLYSYEFPSLSRIVLASLRGLILGLAIGNHVTAVLMAPIFLVAGGTERTGARFLGGWRVNWKSALWQLTFFLLGLLIYLVLPVRASLEPEINWGNPVTAERLWWLISGQLYQQNLFVQPVTTVWPRLGALASLSLEQFGLFGVLVAIVGLVVFYRTDKPGVLCLVQAFLHSIFAVVYGTSDSYLYLLPVWIAFSIWIGQGVVGAHGWLGTDRGKIAWSVSLGLLAYLLILAALNMRRLDASTDFRAETFGKQVMATAPQEAMIFARGDRAVFTLWYFHFALRERPDLIVIAEDLLHFDWYQESLRSVYPSLSLPGPFPWPATIAISNVHRPVCYVEYKEAAHVECSQTQQMIP